MMRGSDKHRLPSIQSSGWDWTWRKYCENKHSINLHWSPNAAVLIKHGLSNVLSHLCEHLWGECAAGAGESEENVWFDVLDHISKTCAFQSTVRRLKFAKEMKSMIRML